MKPKQLIFIILLALIGFVFYSGCEEQTLTSQLGPEWYTQNNWSGNNSIGNISRNFDTRYSPKIVFEKVTHNFGNVGMNSSHICEFRFKNIGNSLLKIDEVKNICGCTPFQLIQREYAPGEIGTLKVQYYAETNLGPITKQLHVYSNDPRNPNVDITIKAKVISKVNCEPTTLNLMLGKNNGSCPPIEISSVDKKPFSIKHFSSTNNCITADFDPSATATKFVIHPKVDTTKLEEGSEGRIEIGLTHPECDSIQLTINTIPKFRISPQTLTITNAEPQKAIYKKVRIFSNYNEKFDLESISSSNNLVKVVSNSRIDNGYELGLEVTPPATNGTMRIFSEVFYVKVKGGQNLEIPLHGFYSHSAVPSRTTARASTRNYVRNNSNLTSTQAFSQNSSSTTTSSDSKKCKKCGPKEYQFDPKKNTASMKLLQEQ